MLNLKIVNLKNVQIYSLLQKIIVIIDHMKKENIKRKQKFIKNQKQKLLQISQQKCLCTADVKS